MTIGIQSDLEDILKHALPDDCEMVGDEHIAHVADAAVNGRSFDDAFDITSRGKEITSIEILRELLLVAQISLLLIQIAQASKSGEDFKKRSEEQKPKIAKGVDLDLWKKLLSKITELMDKAATWLK